MPRRPVVDAVADAVAGAPFPVVVDPVVVAQSGDRLLTGDGLAAVRDRLLPAATVATPNVPEAELLAGVTVEDERDLRAAAEAVRDLGPDAALVTGGHLDGDPVDVLAGETTTAFRRERVDTADTHGSGCTLSAAVAARLAHGDDHPTAVERGVDAVAAAIDSPLSLGGGAGPVDHRRVATAAHRPDAACPGTADAVHAVRSVVAALEADWPLDAVPEVGTNVAVAPADATSPADVVAVDGRLHATARGVRATGGAEPGASSHVARFLLGVRARDPETAAAGNVRYTAARADALADRWDTETVDRSEEPADVRTTTASSSSTVARRGDATARPSRTTSQDARRSEDAGGTMDWAATAAMAGRETAPDAVLDPGAVGKEAMVRVLAPDADALIAKLRTAASV